MTRRVRLMLPPKAILSQALPKRIGVGRPSTKKGLTTRR